MKENAKLILLRFTARVWKISLKAFLGNWTL